MVESDTNSKEQATPDYRKGTVTITLWPGPECDMDKLHSDADAFASRMVEENHVMVDVERKEQSNFKPDK